ncbi:MAG: efflux RND transporter periplasmic adaptor subunit [Deltaproteobacteria bacterium]|nr:efflux RND transporter periplasmic adaptor subunit [Deltaproteobacteria bacterium]
MSGRWTVGLGMALCVAAAACTAESRGAQSDASVGAARRVYPVRWAAARALDGGRDHVDLEALLNAPTRVPLSFKVAGRVEMLDCEEGQFVEPDPEQPVGRLETRDYELAMAAADATLRRAQAVYGRARRVGVAHAQRELDRGRPLADAGVITERDLRGLETQADDMSAQAGEAAAAIAQAQALVAQAEQALADTTILAPFHGLVVKRMVEPGQLVAPGTPACVVERTDELDAVASLPGNLLASLARDVAPTVTVHDAGGLELEGHIEAAAWAGDPQTGTFPVKVRVPNAAGTLRSGMRVTVRLWLRRGGAAAGETIHELPLESVVSIGDRTFAFVPVDVARTTVRRLPVMVRELGRDGLARVLADFPGPPLVVVEGQYSLAELEATELAVREVAAP